MFEWSLISLQVTIDYRKYRGWCTQQHYKSLHLLRLADMSNFNVIVNKVRDQSLFLQTFSCYIVVSLSLVAKKTKLFISINVTNNNLTV